MDLGVVEDDMSDALLIGGITLSRVMGRDWKVLCFDVEW